MRGRGPKRPWTAAEIAVLQAHYLDGGAAACMPLLPGRGSKAIHAKAINQGLRRQQRHAVAQQSNDWIDAAIRHHYREARPQGSMGALAKSLDRSRQWICTRAATLGVLPVTRPTTLWTAEEHAIVEANATKRADAIARMLRTRGYQRTAGAVGERLRNMGVDRFDPDVFSAQELARCMGVDSKTPLRWIERCGLKAKRGGNARSSAWQIHRKDLRDWLKRSADWDHRRCQQSWLVDILTGGQ